MERKKRTLTPEEALLRLMDQCSKAERCSHDAASLLYRWGIGPQHHAAILQRLQQERYIDDLRYAQAFVREKSRHSGWGIRKIEDNLRLKRIDKNHIATALEEADPQQLSDKLDRALATKLPSIKAHNGLQKRDKLIRFGLSRGFPMEQVINSVARLLQNEPEDDF